MADRLRGSLAFTGSAFIHGVLLGALVMWRTPPEAAPRSVYEQEIRPYQSHLVWYDLREKLPDVSPGASLAKAERLRARKKFPQTVVAGEKDLLAPPQLIRMPAPKIELPKALDLPNVLAVAPPKPVHPFQPPAPTPKPVAPAPLLPEAPALAAASTAKALPFDAAAPKPTARAFTPPPSTRPPALPVPAELPAAPEFRPKSLDATAPRIPHGFTAPPAKPAAPAAARPDATPPVPGMTATAPAVATLAIIGLNPSKSPDVPLPPGSHDAGFSAGPEPHPKGASEAPSETAAVTVPGLATRGGAKESSGSLMSVFAPLAARPVGSAPTPARPAPAAPVHSDAFATRVTSSPDPRMNGRYIYTMAIQMPNVTSYSGSWMVWFAGRDPATDSVASGLRAPVATRKVDPKYIQTAVEEKVEGVVRLSAVIRRTGVVDTVRLLRRLDERLDRSAIEALSKWEFQPALRDGVPVDVDAVFEIPFHLAPRTSR